MRVTNKMLSNSFLTDMRTNLENMQTIQQQMTSGKEIRKPSDDPAKVARSMQLNTDINANKQFQQNIDNTTNWLDTTDTALGQAGNILSRVRELMVQAGNGAYSSSERQSIKDEINQKIDEFAQVLNTNFDGKYIFGGTRGTTKPVATQQVDGVNGKNNELVYYSGDPSNVQLQVPSTLIKPTDKTSPTYSTDLNIYVNNMQLGSKQTVEISSGVTMDYNVTAKDVMEFTTSSNGVDSKKSIMDIFKNIVNDLDSNNQADISRLNNEDLSDLTEASNNLLKIRSEVGAKQNRMESAKQKNVDETTNLTTILTKTEDIDITEKTMQYATLQTVYMASLQTSAKVIQPSLLDYLR